MKHSMLALVAFLGISISISAQQKASNKAIIKTPTVLCEMCKNKIEKYLFKQYGISFVDVNYKKKTTTVTWLTDRTDIETIKAAIANAGYDADDVAAEETAYKRLPKCCKKPDPPVGVAENKQ